MSSGPTTSGIRIIKAKGLIFDLDGTLISTLDVTEKIYTKYCRIYNIDPRPVLEFCHGVPTPQVLAKFYPPETHTPEFARKLELESLEALDGIKTIPGARELMNSLPSDRWSIFTSGMRLLAFPRLEHLKLPIPKVFVTPENITKGKPDPEGYILAAEKMGFDPKQCVVFEDALAGTVAGYESGATVVGVTTQLSDEKLVDAGASCTVKDMSCVSVNVDDDEGDLVIILKI